MPNPIPLATRIFLCLCWTPPVAFLAGRRYVAGYEGWGAWAAAQILVIPFVASVVLGTAGAVLCLVQWRTQRPLARLLAATLLAASVALYLAIRALLA